MFKNLIMVGVLSASVFASIHEVKPETITEHFIIQSIDNEGYVHGEIIPDKHNRTGEGIYYSVEQLKDAGLKHANVGDKISVTWEQKDYYNEYWENIYDAENE